MINNTNGDARIILIDDDEVYNAIMLRVAEQAGVRLDVYTSLLHLGSVALFGRYDVAIVDYQLGQMTGVEIAQYLSALFRNLPMILVSQTEDVGEARLWPDSIASFISKAAGYRHVIEQATRLAQHHAVTSKPPGSAAAFAAS